MNEKDLYRAIGEICDDLIMEADNYMKKTRRIKWTKIAVIAAAAAAVMSISAVAGSKIVSRHGSSWNIPDYTQIPSEEVLLKDVGMVPSIVDEFSNGYKFKSGHISKNWDEDESGNAVEYFSGLDIKYEKDGDVINIDTDASGAGIMYSDDDKAEIYEGIDIFYSEFQNKLVPPDYKLTEQDKKDEEEGKYVFSYGSDKVEVSCVQIAAFSCNGVNYTLCAIDSSVTKDEMLDMTKEIIALSMEK